MMNTTSNMNSDTPLVFTFSFYIQLAQGSSALRLLMPQSRLRSQARFGDKFGLSTFTQLGSDFLDIKIQKIAQTPGHWHKHYVQFEIDGIIQSTGKSEKVTDPTWVETFSLCVSHFLSKIRELTVIKQCPAVVRSHLPALPVIRLDWPHRLPSWRSCHRGNEGKL